MLNWLFGKGDSKKKELDLLHIGVDIHSHLIPGIDDGVQSVEESLTMIKKMIELGINQIYTTPHVIWDCYRNTPDTILSGLEMIRNAVVEAQLPVSINAAAEYFIDEHFIQMMQTGERLLTLPGNRLLVELPYSTPLMNTSETLFMIVEKGYQPVLAHPERYAYFHNDLSVYRKLVDGGCELQLNVLSLSGHYGPGVTRTAEWLLENHLITFLGTDAHKMAHLDSIQKSNRHGWLLKYPFQNEKLAFIRHK
ncbi:tyrosine-protein phosphatase [Dyadobacter fermentans]|uniref:tyrosine-protein phosphatase n=1 Tax=Dyadobacter fermentans TaxID=94254 RepID=UPI001CBADB77|nr:CpsB/CapC family capsule biosynthesis tyrosine phosphatase [Dyadobacter fermentans]MBZ1357368.1 histidinol phosphatase [Dyadobacter fermentans]